MTAGWTRLSAINIYHRSNSSSLQYQIVPVRKAFAGRKKLSKRMDDMRCYADDWFLHNGMWYRVFYQLYTGYAVIENEAYAGLYLCQDGERT